MAFPQNYKYTQEHDWLLVEGNTVTVGVTSFAVEQLGDVVHVELPEVGSLVEAGDDMGSVESTKTVSDLHAPVNGKIVEVNPMLSDSPEKLMEDPHGVSWICKIQMTGSLPADLMGASQYTDFCAEEAH